MFEQQNTLPFHFDTSTWFTTDCGESAEGFSPNLKVCVPRTIPLEKISLSHSSSLSKYDGLIEILGSKTVVLSFSSFQCIEYSHSMSGSFLRTVRSTLSSYSLGGNSSNGYIQYIGKTRMTTQLFSILKFLSAHHISIMEKNEKG